MMIRWHRFPLAALGLGLVPLSGCDQGPAVHQVQGQVVLSGVNGNPLENSHVELQSEADPNVRPTGLIGPDGRFELQTQHGAKLLKGAPEGRYQARIIPATDEDDARQARRKGFRLENRYRDFKKSGLTVEVPPGGDVTLTVQAAQR